MIRLLSGGQVHVNSVKYNFNNESDQNFDYYPNTSSPIPAIALLCFSALYRSRLVSELSMKRCLCVESHSSQLRFASFSDRNELLMHWISFVVIV